MVSRDSVAAGDDVESDDQYFEVDGRRPLQTFIQSVVRGGYLPRIASDRVTWVVMAGRRGRFLAIVARQWSTPEMLVELGTQVGEVGDSLHFRYITQQDPQEVLDEMRAAVRRRESVERPIDS